MKSSHTLALLVISFCLIAPAHAGNRNAYRRAVIEAAAKKKEERERKRKARAAERKKVDAFMDPLDKNNDNSISLEEFTAGGKDEAQFDKFNKNKDGYLSKSEVKDLLGL